MTVELMFAWGVFLPVLAMLLLVACSQHAASPGADQDAPAMMLTSEAFAPGETIPQRHVRQGENLSPPLAWSNVPPGTKQFALVADDPDAPVGNWVHWVVYNIPADVRSITAGAVPDGAAQGTNGWDEIGYGGPQPPGGQTHRYFFKLYALNAELNLKPGLDRRELLDELRGHILAQAELMGTYPR